MFTSVVDGTQYSKGCMKLCLVLLASSFTLSSFFQNPPQLDTSVHSPTTKTVHGANNYINCEGAC